MNAPAHDKYYLKSLHEEIDLFDRKLAHLLKYDTFETEAARAASAGKLNAKRELLARTARQLVRDGIEFKPTDLPRSFRTEADASALPEAVVPAPAEAALPKASMRQFPSPFEGTVLDGRASLQEYKRTRVKAALKGA